MSKFAKPLLNASLAILLGAGLLGQAFAGEQLKTIQEKGVINVGLEGTYHRSASRMKTVSWPASKSSCRSC